MTTLAREPIERFEDLEDGPESLGRGDDGKIPQYSWQDGHFVMVPMPEERRGGSGTAIAAFSPGGATRLRDMTDVSGTLGAGSDGYAYLYDNDSDTFVLSEISTSSTIAGASDFTDTTGPGTDGYSVVWDNDTGKFALSNVSGGSGTPGGASSQVQHNSSGSFAGHSGFTYDGAGTATLGTALVASEHRPPSDGTAAWKITNAANDDDILVADTTNGRIGIAGPAGSQTVVINGTGSLKATSASNPLFLCEYTSGPIIKMQALSSVALFGTQSNHRLDFYVNNSFAATLTTDERFRVHINQGNGQISATTSATSRDGLWIKLNSASHTGNAIKVINSASSEIFGIGSAGQIRTAQSSSNTNTPSGQTAHQLPIYNGSGVLLGYIPVYESVW